MSSYVEDALVNGERILHQGRLSLWSVWHLLILGLVLLPAFGLGLIFWVIAYVRIKSTELAVTSKRLIVKHGFVRRSTIEINLGKVESIQADQGVLGRVLNFGTLVISGTGTSHAPISGIADPMAFRKAFIEAQDGARREA
jgi:membrane protein YdbS with pleckstrin-like domain